MQRFLERFQTKKKLKLEKSVIGSTAIEAQKVSELFHLPNTEKRQQLQELVFSTDSQVWKKIADDFGDTISLESDGFIGNCEDYVHSVYPDVPQKVLYDRNFLEKSFVPKDEVNSSERYLIIYWGSEEQNAQDAKNAGFIRENVKVPQGRLIPVHVGITEGDHVVSKFSLSGGLIRHTIDSVPSSYGNNYSFHKIR